MSTPSLGFVLKHLLTAVSVDDCPKEMHTILFTLMRFITSSEANAQNTHPGIYYPIFQLSPVMHIPSRKHVDDARRVIEYSYHTHAKGFTIRNGQWTATCGEGYPPNIPAVYVDSSFAGSEPDVHLHTHTRIVIMMNAEWFANLHHISPSKTKLQLM